MSSLNDKDLVEIMGKVFPGYEEFKPDSVTPAITGGDRLSFMIVCNDEAKKSFQETEDIFSQLFLDTTDGTKGFGLDLNLRFEFTFPAFKLQFFAVIEGKNVCQQHSFAKLLQEVDRFIIWLVDEEKSIINVLQVAWDIGEQSEIVEKVLDGLSEK